MKQEEKIIAIHEAAHAAICLKEKVSFGKVTIFSNEDYFGKVALSKDFITNLISNPKVNVEKKFNLFRKYLMCLVAGKVAEQKVHATTSYATKDDEVAFDLIGEFFPNLKTGLAFHDYIVLEVESCFSFFSGEEENEIEDTPLWNFVLKLSEELIIHKEVEHQACKKLYKEFSY